MQNNTKIIIRNATLTDLDDVTAVEKACFPCAEAATKEEFAERLKYYGNHFLLLFTDNRLVSFVDGFVNDSLDLKDEMYEMAELHCESGQWQMIFGVNTLPEYRRNGYAEKLLKQFIEDAKSQHRKGIVLTCKQALIHYYAKFGFLNEGISQYSTHGNAEWYQMRLTF